MLQHIAVGVLCMHMSFTHEQQFNVQSIPHVCVLKGDAVLHSFTGVVSNDALEKFLSDAAQHVTEK